MLLVAHPNVDVAVAIGETTHGKLGVVPGLTVASSRAIAESLVGLRCALVAPYFGGGAPDLADGLEVVAALRMRDPKGAVALLTEAPSERVAAIAAPLGVGVVSLRDVVPLRGLVQRAAVGLPFAAPIVSRSLDDDVRAVEDGASQPFTNLERELCRELLVSGSVESMRMARPVHPDTFRRQLGSMLAKASARDAAELLHRVFAPRGYGRATGGAPGGPSRPARSRQRAHG